MKTNLKFIVLFLVFCSFLSYSFAFWLTGSVDRLPYFDTVMAQDMAQIARNTLNGNILATKYVLPVGYAVFPAIENHPDYIRYPLPTILYASLFLIYPESAATVKLFNAFIFLVNAALIFFINLHLIRRNNINLSSDRDATLIALFATLSCSLLCVPYLKLAISDAYEVFTISILLIAFIVSFVRVNPLLAGVTGGMLYLSRSNMAVYWPIMLFSVVYQSSGKDAKIRNTAKFIIASFLVFLPIFARNMFFVGKPLFSLQQSVELLKGITGTHSQLYREFLPPPSLSNLSGTQYYSLINKFLKNIKLPLSYISDPTYYIPLLGLIPFAHFFRKFRWVLLCSLAFVVLHTAACSLFVQIERVYVPVFFTLLLFGYLGLAVTLFSALQSIDVRFFLPSIVVCVFSVVFSPLMLRKDLIIFTDPRTIPPSNEIIDFIKENKIFCTYSNNPFWIPWYTNIVSIYEPLNNAHIFSRGPKECHYFVVDKRYRFPKSFLDVNGDKFYEDDGAIVFRLTQTNQ